RYPQQLAGELTPPLRQIQAGGDEARGVGLVFRIVVPNPLPLPEQNALLHPFSNRGEQLRYAPQHYKARPGQTSTLVIQLCERFVREVDAMPTSEELPEEFARETIDKLLKELPTERILQAVPAERILQAVPLEKVLEGIPADKRLEGIPADKRLEGIP